MNRIALLHAWLTVLLAAAPEDRRMLGIFALRNGVGLTDAYRCDCRIEAVPNQLAHPAPLTITGVVKHLRDHPSASGFHVDESRVSA